MDRVRAALSRSARHGSWVAIFHVDLDRFRSVNDALGHEAGDQVLVTVARRLRGALRGFDTVGRPGTVGTLEGDDFLVVCEDLPDQRRAVAIAMRLRHAVSGPTTVDHRDVVVTATVGLVLAREPSEDPSTLLRRAETAVHRAKERDAHRVEVFDEELQEEASEMVELGTALRSAAGANQLGVHYQPIVRVDSGLVVGVEALARWAHPGRGPVPTAKFIALAEQMGLMSGVAQWVLEQACSQATRWHASPGTASVLAMSVNLSARQLVGCELAGTVARVLEDSGLAPRQLSLEITESSIIRDTTAARTTLRSLKDLGVRILVDDFGTGYASLNHLRHVPVDGLKVDRSIVDELGSSPDAEAIVRGVIALAHGLGLSVVAEGVETSEQLGFLADLGCELGQGYHWSPPLPADQLGRWLDAHSCRSAHEPILLTGDPQILDVDAARQVQDIT